MGGPNIYTEGLFEIADVVATRQHGSGEVLSNLGDAARGTGIDSDVPAWGTPGFVSVPMRPSGAGSEQAVFYVDGFRRFVFGRRDRRFAANAGTKDEGDAVVHGLSSGARLHVDDSAPSLTMETATTPTNYRVVLGTSGVDVTGVSTSTQSVALYDPIQPLLQELVDTLQLLIAGDPLATPTPIPGLGTIIAALPGANLLAPALATQLTTLQAAAVAALNASLASSAVLRASTS